MLDSKKFVAAMGVLGSFALIGVGAAQAFAGGDASGGCVSDGKGNTRCTQVREYQVTTDSNGNISVVNDSRQNCPAAGGRVDCVSSFTLPGESS